MFIGSIFSSVPVYLSSSVSVDDKGLNGFQKEGRGGKDRTPSQREGKSA